MPELRKDPIIGRWVIIATERGKRPSDFMGEVAAPRGGFCPLCPGNEDKTPPEVYALRPDGSGPNSPGWRLRIVKNKFPALVASEPLEHGQVGIYDWMSGVGDHEVIIETPHHDRKMADFEVSEVEDVLIAFRERIRVARQDRRFQYVMVFKNHGSPAGASLDHAHSQLVALPIVPKRVAEEVQGAKAHYLETKTCIFCDIINQERTAQVRVIEHSDGFIALAPFASRFPFETWVLPQAHSASYEREEGYGGLAQVLLGVLRRIDRVLDDPPFNILLHTSPFSEPDSPYYHWHLEVIPKLTKVAGFEWGSGFYINPTPPEEAARFLREGGSAATPRH